MSDNQSPLSGPAGRESGFVPGRGRGEILSWLAAGALPKGRLEEAFRIAGCRPDAAAWRRFLDLLALWLGSMFMAAAVIFFLAYNWSEIGKFARFGAVETALAASVLAAWRTGIDRMAGRAALLASILLLGGLLALFGQTYQTGADPWELFALWALLALPWVLLSRFPAAWLVWLILLNLSVSMYHHAFAGIFTILGGGKTLCWILSALNCAALALWEAVSARFIWLREGWVVRLVATAAASCLTLLASWGIVDRHGSGVPELIAYLAALVLCYLAYRLRRTDLYMLALGVLSIIIVTAVFLGHSIFKHTEAAITFLLIGVVVIALSAAGGWWLRSVARGGYDEQ